MTTKFKVTNPDDIEFELVVKMPLRDWRRIKTQLSSMTFPASDLSLTITDMIIQAEKTFYPEEKKP